MAGRWNVQKYGRYNKPKAAVHSWLATNAQQQQQQQQQQQS
jgi:hypothetical protein